METRNRSVRGVGMDRQPIGIGLGIPLIWGENDDSAAYIVNVILPTCRKNAGNIITDTRKNGNT
jgi:hypothetical protein